MTDIFDILWPWAARSAFVGSIKPLAYAAGLIGAAMLSLAYYLCLFSSKRLQSPVIIKIFMITGSILLLFSLDMKQQGYSFYIVLLAYIGLSIVPPKSLGGGSRKKSMRA